MQKESGDALPHVVVQLPCGVERRGGHRETQRGSDRPPALPRPEDIDLSGLDMTTQDVADLLTVDKELWKEDAEGIASFYAKFGDKLPKELAAELETLKKNLE